MAAAVQPNRLGTSQNTLCKTFGTSGRPTLQGDPSGDGLPFVDIRLKVVIVPEQLGKSVDDSADDVDAIRVVGKSYNPNNQEHQRRPVVRGARDRSSTSSRERQQQHRKKDKRDLIKVIAVEYID